LALNLVKDLFLTLLANSSAYYKLTAVFYKQTWAELEWCKNIFVCVL